MFKQIKNYLSLSRKEWNGLVVLFIIIVLVLLAPYGYRAFHPYKQLDKKAFDAAVKKLYPPVKDSLAKKGVPLFKFDPNRLPDSLWQKLGMNDQQISTIKNYEAKGGRFYSKADLQKIYAITPNDYYRLKPYINLPEKTYTEKTNAVVEINTTDTTKLQQIRGIGPGFAVRIIRYRDRLGGFYKKEQLKEVFGLDSLMYVDIAPFIRIDKRKILQTNINKATTNSLIAFPYLSYKQKNAIVEYRNQHGDYKSLDDLKNIPIISDDILRKIEPYFSFK